MHVCWRRAAAVALMGAMMAALALSEPRTASAQGFPGAEAFGRDLREGDEVFWSRWGPNEPAVVLRLKPRFGEALIESLASGDTHWVRASDLIRSARASASDDAAELDLMLDGADPYCAIVAECF